MDNPKTRSRIAAGEKNRENASEIEVKVTARRILCPVRQITTKALKVSGKYFYQRVNKNDE